MTVPAKISHRLNVRRAGILLHPTSLPGTPVNGDLGANAYWFVDFLVSCGISVWQTLPLGPPDTELSPYQSPSAHAGNPRLICLKQLEEYGWLKADAQVTHASETAWYKYRNERLSNAYEVFSSRRRSALHEEYDNFRRDQAHWLDDYALFQVFKTEYDQQAWWEWKAVYRDRDPEALLSARKRFAAAIDYYRFEQFLFFHQWRLLKQYANERGVLIFGDLPIFVSADSVDVWANRQNFQLDTHGRATVVAGVPPDYFSATGQLWGNPHYDWNYMQANGFHWWVERLRTQQALFDLVRIDHFRGFEAYWEIPASAPTAMEGRWVKAPGEALINTLDQVGSVPLVAEDLGVITAEVTALRKKFNIPGMKILQFAFEGGAANPYLPHNHRSNYVVYTGTHDNDTTLGWFNALSPELQGHVCDYLGAQPDTMPWPLIRAAFASPARLAIVPMQDILALDSSHRMNRPGISGGMNWRWRFTWEQVPSDLHLRMRHLLGLYGRFS
jgi:4-alpha-glucanotransferase